jgi:uncharacterized cupin superfamily protein
MKIKVEKADQERLDKLGVKAWPTWEAEPSTFPWHYDEQEICYFLEGKVVVTADDQRVEIAKGDLVTFPEGMDCEWRVVQKVRKHYKFG